MLLCVAVLLVVLLCIRHGRPALKKLTARDDIPGYALLYADRKQDKNEDFGRLLYSAKYDLQGRPDYVFCSRLLRRIVPVELKSGCIGEAEEPHHGDFLQLAAYFLILEDVYGKRPAYGRLVYRDYMFEIKNTARVRRKCGRCFGMELQSRSRALPIAAPASATERSVSFRKQK